jgi:plasmid maintenance system antidote protein VapI
MSKKNAAQPINPFHRGEILLEEFLQPGKITQAAFAPEDRMDRGKAERIRPR